MPSNFFILETNPEIFTMTPRVGGIANIKIVDRKKKEQKVPDKASKSNISKKSRSRVNTAASKTKNTASTTKTSTSKSESETGPSKKSLLTCIDKNPEKTIHLDLDTSPKFLKIKETVAASPWALEFDDYLEPPDETNHVPDPFQDAVDLCATTISIIMLMSTDYKVQDYHLKWALSYLDCIEDDFGRIPPNVQGIINHINMLTGRKIKSYLDEDDDNSELKAVRIAEGPPEVAPVDPDAEAEEQT